METKVKEKSPNSCLRLYLRLISKNDPFIIGSEDQQGFNVFFGKGIQLTDIIYGLSIDL
jgi:hypothetical protein